MVFYASGHAGLETAYLWGLMARLYGNNNLPQSSNMCHETTSVGLKQVIGSAVGTVLWEDLEATDCLFFFGQNPGSPRFLHPLKAAKDRGARIITFNPVREPGLVAFVDPQNLYEMATGHTTTISDQYRQLKAGSDIAALLGLCKAVIEADDAARAQGAKPLIDQDFIREHTVGFESFEALARNTHWDAILTECGLSEQDLRAAARVYCESERVIGVYGMGLTQHGERVALVGDAGDGVERRLGGLSVVRFDLPRGTVGSYYPECNVLVPLGLCDQRSKTPASKAVPVRIERDAVAA